MAHINLYYDSLHESRDWEAYSPSLVHESTVQKTCVCVCEIERDLFWVQKLYVCVVCMCMCTRACMLTLKLRE